MSQASIHGKFTEEFELTQIISHSKVQLDSKDIFENWRRCSITANFFAKYYSSFFPEDDCDGKYISKKSAEYSISYLLNELFENAAKFSNAGKKSVFFEVFCLKHYILFQVSNYILAETKLSFSDLIQELLSNDPGELYIKKVEENIDTGKAGSGLGYLTLMNDYNITFGYKFEPVLEEPNIFKVTIQAYHNYEENIN
jgi:hypothetical protein